MLQVWEKVRDGEAGQGSRVLAEETQQALRLPLLGIPTQVFGEKTASLGQCWTAEELFHPSPPRPAPPLGRPFTTKIWWFLLYGIAKGTLRRLGWPRATWSLWGATFGRDSP